jgi:chemotaxis signal transduction protein
MAARDKDQIHALAIPTRAGSILVPSATIAEVVNVTAIAPMPLAPAWVIGAVGWRSLAVTVVSFEALLGQAASAPASASKAVVFYPLTGRPQTEFFAILSSSEPRPAAIDSSAVSLGAADLPKSPFVAAGLKLNGQSFWIPGFDELKKAFYPV